MAKGEIIAAGCHGDARAHPAPRRIDAGNHPAGSACHPHGSCPRHHVHLAIGGGDPGGDHGGDAGSASVDTAQGLVVTIGHPQGIRCQGHGAARVAHRYRRQLALARPALNAALVGHPHAVAINSQEIGETGNRYDLFGRRSGLQGKCSRDQGKAHAGHDRDQALRAFQRLIKGWKGNRNCSAIVSRRRSSWPTTADSPSR